MSRHPVFAAMPEPCRIYRTENGWLVLELPSVGELTAARMAELKRQVLSVEREPWQESDTTDPDPAPRPKVWHFSTRDEALNFVAKLMEALE